MLLTEWVAALGRRHQNQTEGHVVKSANPVPWFLSCRRGKLSRKQLRGERAYFGSQFKVIICHCGWKCHSGKNGGGVVVEEGAGGRSQSHDL